MLYIYSGASQPFNIPLLKILCLVLYPILIWLFDSLNSLPILDINPLSDVGFVKIFSQSVGCHFVLLKLSFALQKLGNVMRAHSLILDLRA